MRAICLVVPCFNEAQRLDVHAFETFMDANAHVSFCFVDDGSRDRTIDVLNRMAATRLDTVRVLQAPANRGKAEAVRLGMLDAVAWKPFSHIGYWDADLATPLDELAPMVRIAQGPPERLMVLGSRVKRLGTSIERSLARHYPARLFATGASIVLRLPVYDTQCGAKLVASSLVPRLFEEPFGSRWIFDVEVLARLRSLVGRDALLAGTVEAPLNAWEEKPGSRMSLRAFLAAPFELWSIERRFNGHRARRSGDR